MSPLVEGSLEGSSFGSIENAFPSSIGGPSVAAGVSLGNLLPLGDVVGAELSGDSFLTGASALGLLVFKESVGAGTGVSTETVTGERVGATVGDPVGVGVAIGVGVGAAVGAPAGAGVATGGAGAGLETASKVNTYGMVHP